MRRRMVLKNFVGIDDAVGKAISSCGVGLVTCKISEPSGGVFKH